MKKCIAAVFLAITLPGALLGCALYYAANYVGLATLVELSAADFRRRRESKSRLSFEADSKSRRLAEPNCRSRSDYL